MHTDDFSPSQIGEQKNEDVRRLHTLIQSGPVVPLRTVFAHVWPDTGGELMVHGPHVVD